jgi:hypothetical protein
MLLVGLAALVLAWSVPRGSIYWITYFAGTLFASAWGPVAFMSVWSSRITESAASWDIVMGFVANLAARTGANGDTVAGRCRIKRIERVRIRQVEPWLRRVRDEQAVFDKSAHDTGDDAIQEFLQMLLVRRVHQMETRSVALQRIDPVQNDHVQVYLAG